MKPFCRYIAHWIIEGILEDPYQEFWIERFEFSFKKSDMLF